MKKILMLFSFLACFAYANAIKNHTSGDLTVLKGVKKVNIQFTYNDMVVGGMTESGYIEKKVSEYNAKKEGRGDEFAKVWEHNKINVYPVNFIELFEKGTGIKCDANNTDEEYTIIVNTTFFEPGFNVGVVRRNAEVSVVVKVVKASEPEKVLAEVSAQNCPGRTVWGYDFDVASRVSEAYAKAGKEVAKVVKKACK